MVYVISKKSSVADKISILHLILHSILIFTTISIVDQCLIAEQISLPATRVPFKKAKVYIKFICTPP